MQLLLTLAVVLTVRHELKSFETLSLEIFVCEILAAGLICVACVSCTLRLGTDYWPLGILYLLFPSFAFGGIFGAISVVYFADTNSFLVIFIFH